MSAGDARDAAATDGPGSSTDETPAAATSPAADLPADVPEEVLRRAGLEAILFLADEPVPLEVLAEAVEDDPAVVAADLEDLVARDAAEQRGIGIRPVAGGWRMYTAPFGAPAVERWAVAGRSGRLTQAALETLAVVAYKQPISRAEVGDIRGVNADGAIRSLVARGLVAEVGRDPGPGQAVLYGTTTTFLERLGIDSLDDLPALTDFLPEAPAPDEPELGALKEIRRRLAAGGELESTPSGAGEQPPAADDDEDVLPPPTATRRAAAEDAEMEELTDRLDEAARSAVSRLRQAVAADDESQPEGPDDAESEESDAPREGGPEGAADA